MNSGFLESASEQINKSMPSLEGKSVSDLKSFGLGIGQHPGFRPGIPCGLSAFLHASGPSGRHDVAWPSDCKTEGSISPKPSENAYGLASRPLKSSLP